jgi:hypothetical protein
MAIHDPSIHDTRTAGFASSPGEGTGWAGSAFQHPTQHDQLSKVIGVVVGHQERLSQQGLAGAVGNSSKQVVRWVGDEFAHLSQI